MHATDEKKPAQNKPLGLVYRAVGICRMDAKVLLVLAFVISQRVNWIVFVEQKNGTCLHFVTCCSHNKNTGRMYRDAKSYGGVILVRPLIVFTLRVWTLDVDSLSSSSSSDCNESSQAEQSTLSQTEP